MKYLVIAIFFNFFGIWAQSDGQTVYRITEVDTRPKILQGSYTLTMFLSENLILPEIRNKKIHAITSFIVEPDGNISDVQFIHMRTEDLISTTIQESEDLPEDLKNLREEIVCALQKFDRKWSPAYKDGKAVRCLYHFPVNLNFE